MPQRARYAGPGPACRGATATTATLVLTGKTFAFAPTDGSVIVRGSIEPDGSFAGSLAQKPLRSEAADRGSAAISVAGTLTGEAARIDYAAPRCSATLSLARVS